MRRMLLPALPTLLVALPLCASDFPAPYNTETGDESRRLSGIETAATMKLPPGFKATLFAAEPDVQNPIAMSWDARGRLWVAENYTYAESPRKFDLALRDRILIFEDADGDGKFDTRKVFTDEIQMLTSIEVVPGGVWVMAPPQLLFIPDRNGDDIPDSPAEVMLDGFTGSREAQHTFANGLRMGPDGWLYGRCGASSPGELGIPGAAPGERIPLRGGVWRFNPRNFAVEVIASGTTNPWGHDWDANGELFFINTVNGHLWHGIAGAHFPRSHTFEPNPRAYTVIEQHADHWHFDTAGGWVKSRDGAANDLGGGHAHVGMMIYQGDNWPAEYRGHLFTLNFHGRRMNQEILERAGSGYVGKHGADFMIAADPWFRGMELSNGPDGGVMALDWSDTGECHDSTGVHRTSGRIYKITHGDAKRGGPRDLSKLTAAELVQLQLHANEWFARQARLELAARFENKRPIEAIAKQLRDLFEKQNETPLKLRALWTLNAVGALDNEFQRAQLKHPDEHIRAWAIRLLTDHWPLDTMLSARPKGRPEPSRAMNLLPEFARLAASDPSGLVRLTLASALQRLSIANRPELAAALLSHKEDANDHNLPALIWFGLIPVADADPRSLATLGENAQIPFTRKLIARRLAEDIEKNPAAINQLVAAAAKAPPEFQLDVLTGMAEGLAGWRKAAKPAAWDALAARVASNSSDTTNAAPNRVRELSLLFGDGRALGELKTLALERRANFAARKAALQSVIGSGGAEARAVCLDLISEQFINPTAARGLAAFDDEAAAKTLALAYRFFHASERGQLLSVLVSRPRFAAAMLDAVAEKRIPRADITPYHARQIRSLNDEALNQKLAAVWGELRETAIDKRSAIAAWKSKLASTPATLAQADLSQGRAAFNLACAPCHTLYGEGGKVGPDLTGSGRDDLDYLLENIIDPSAVVSADFRMTVIETKDGRTLNGLIPAKTDRTVTLKTMTETITLDRAEIAALRESPLSLMPEGLLEALPPDQARDLIAYLMRRTQVPLRAVP